MSSNQKVYINEFESLEQEPEESHHMQVRDEEAEKRFSNEFGAFLSAKSEQNESVTPSKTESIGTIYFSSIDERIEKFSQVEQPTDVLHPEIRIPGVVKEMVNEKNIKQTAALSRLVGRSIFDLFKEYVFFSTKAPKKDQDPKKLEHEAKKSANKSRFLESLRGIGGKSKVFEAQKLTQSEQINRKLGGNLSYEGELTESLELRIDVETLMNKKNSELTENEIRAKRARAIQAASSGKKGRRVTKQELNPEKGINAGQRNAYTQAG